MNQRKALPARSESTTRAHASERFFERLPEVVRHSYLLSRTWSWISRIEITPRVRVPVPRVFTQRDP